MVATVEVKTCRECKAPLPLTEFSIKRSSKDNRMNICKTCDKQKAKAFYRNNPEYFKKYKIENRGTILLKQRECNFLYGYEGRGSGYLEGTGICVFCGEINPFLLELHPPFGPDHPFKIHECAKCHCLQHRFPAMLEVTL